RFNTHPQTVGWPSAARLCGRNRVCHVQTTCNTRFGIEWAIGCDPLLPRLIPGESAVSCPVGVDELDGRFQPVGEGGMFPRLCDNLNDRLVFLPHRFSHHLLPSA